MNTYRYRFFCYALSFGAPLHSAAVVALRILWRRGLATGWFVILASLLVIGCTTLVLVGGIRFFRDALPGFYLSDIVWWMRPVEGLFGV
jgi:hypothetical protein